MKIHGNSFPPPVRDVVFARPGNTFIALKVQGLISLDLFHKLVEMPLAPMVRVPNQAAQSRTDDPGYLAAVKDYGEMRTAFLLIHSLAATPGITWDKVVLDDPSTWLHWKQELLDLGLVHFEIEHLLQELAAVNGLVGAVEEAKKAFLAFMATANQQS